MDKKKVLTTIYTDGSCKGNPGKGGFAVYWETKVNDILIDQNLIAQPKDHTTNNERELSAFLQALEIAANTFRTAKRAGVEAKVVIVADSKYCLDPITKGWISNWKAKGWKNNGEYRPNYQLWQKVYDLIHTKIGNEDLVLKWVRGHQNNNSGNDLVDKYAVLACENQKAYRLTMKNFEGSVCCD